MKKILLLLTVLLSSPLLIAVADNTLDALIAFNKGEKKHKNECFEYEKNFLDEKFDLLKKQHDEMFDLRDEVLAKLKSEGFSEKLLKEKLAAKIAMCERHMEQWKSLCEDHHLRGKEMYKNAKAKLDAFKQAYLGSGYTYRPYETRHEGPTFLEQVLEKLRTSAGV